MPESPRSQQQDDQQQQQQQQQQQSTSSPSGVQTDLEAFAIEAARLMADLKCEDVVVMDVRELSQVTKYVVVGTGTSERQLRSVAKSVMELGEEHGHEPFRSNLERSTTWAIVDFVDCTVHLFEANARAFYDLESLWGEAPRVEWTRSGVDGGRLGHRGPR